MADFVLVDAHYTANICITYTLYIISCYNFQLYCIFLFSFTSFLFHPLLSFLYFFYTTLNSLPISSLSRYVVGLWIKKKRFKRECRTQLPLSAMAQETRNIIYCLNIWIPFTMINNC